MCLNVTVSKVKQQNRHKKTSIQSAGCNAHYSAHNSKKPSAYIVSATRQLAHAPYTVLLHHATGGGLFITIIISAVPQWQAGSSLVSLAHHHLISISICKHQCQHLAHHHPTQWSVIQGLSLDSILATNWLIIPQSGPLFGSAKLLY